MQCLVTLFFHNSFLRAYCAGTALDMLANLPQYVGKRRQRRTEKRLHLATFPLSRVALFKLGVLTGRAIERL